MNVLKKTALGMGSSEQDTPAEKPMSAPPAAASLAKKLEDFSTLKIGNSTVRLMHATIQPDDFEEIFAIPPENKRAQVLLEHRGVDDLLAELEAYGKFNTPIVCQYRNGKYEPLDGSRRKMAASIFGCPIDIHYFNEDVPREDIVAYIKSTQLSKKWSDFEKLLIVNGEYNAVVAESSGKATLRSNLPLMASLLTDQELPSNKTYCYAVGNICDTLKLAFFNHGDPNKFSFDQLSTLASILKRLIDKKPADYTDDKLQVVFKKTFDFLDDEFGGIYSFRDFKVCFEKELGVKAVRASATPPVVMVSTDDCKVTFTEKGDKWDLKGTARLPNSVKSEIQSILQDYFGSEDE